MKQIEQKKITDIKSNIAKKIKLLRKTLETHPAYPRRKKDEANWETFFTISVFIALAGIIIFGTGGWLAVAASGTLLSLIIVESGLFSSLAMGFSAWPVYNTYLWMRDLFSSEKIKNQNKDYDRCHKNLLELKELAAEKNYLSAKINIQLNNATQCLISIVSGQEKTDFLQLGLTKQIEKLEKEKRILPAYSRKQKDKHTRSKIFQYSVMTSCAGLGLYAIVFIIMAGIPAPILLGPILPFLILHLSITLLVSFGPVTFGSLLYGAYVYTRDLFSSAEIKAENKQYAQLTKTIRELKKLDKQDSQLDTTINSKIEGMDGNLAQTTDDQKTGKFCDSLQINATKNNINWINYKPLFSVPSNQNLTNAILSSNFTL